MNKKIIENTLMLDTNLIRDFCVDDLIEIYYGNQIQYETRLFLKEIMPAICELMEDITWLLRNNEKFSAADLMEDIYYILENYVKKE